MGKFYIFLASALALSGGAFASTFKNSSPIVTKAEIGTGKIIVGGTDLVKDSDHTIEGTGGGTATLTYNENDEPVITLDNYVYSGWGHGIYLQDFYGIFLNRIDKTVHIELKGNNSITLDYPYTQKRNSYGIFSDYTNLVINGGNSDTLTINADSAPWLSIGLWSRGAVTTTINGGTINANANTGGNRSVGVFCEASATYPGDFIMNGGTLNAKGAECTYDGNDDRYTSYGFWGNGVRLTLNDGTINATGGTTACNNSVSAGIGSAHSITLNGGVLNAYGAKDNGSFKSYGIRNAKNLIINDKVEQVILAGATGTYTGTITNNVPGNGYDNYDGIGEATIIPAKTAFETYKRALFKNIGATITSYEGTYDNANHSISIANLNPNTAVVKYGTEEGTYNLTSAPSYKEPGTYTTYYKITADGYTDKIGSATVKINKIANSWTTTPVFATDLVYDGSSHPLITNGGAVESGTIKYQVGEGEYGTDIPEAINAGTYSLRATVEVDDYHNQPADVIGSVTIAQAENSIVEPVVGVSDLVYDGQSHPLVQEGFEAGHGDVYFSLSETGEYTKDIPSATDAGTYTVYYKVVSDDPNYEDIAAQHFDVVIAKSANEYKTIPSSKTDLTYTGSPITLVNAGEPSGGKIFYKLGDGEYSEELPSATNAGTYTVYYKVEGAPNHEDVGEQSFTVTIAKAIPTFKNEPTAFGDLVYDGQSHPLVQEGFEAGHGDVYFSLSETGEYTKDIPSATDAGTYTVYYKVVSDDPNYEDIAAQHFDVVIAKSANEYKTIPSSKTDLTYTGSPITLVNAGEPSGGKIFYKLGDGEYSEELPSATNAGTYTVYYKVVSDDPNYEDVGEQSFTVTIAKAISTYENEPTAVSGLGYTGQAQALVQEGFEAEHGDVYFSLSETGEYTKDIPSATNAGTYTVYYKVISDDPNYEDIAEQSFTVTIAKAISTFKNEPTAVSGLGYTGQAQALVNAGSSNDGEIQYSLSQSGTFSSAIPSASKAGEYTVYYKIVGDENHNDSEVKYVKVTIASRETLVDGESGVKIETKDGASIASNINLRVEVRTDVKAEKGSDDYNAIKKMLTSDEKISNVFDIKLIKTEGNVETEIQPSDIKEGMKLIVHVKAPEGLKTEGLRILHIHNNGQMEFIEDYKLENGEFVFEISSLSELALVTKVDFKGLPGWGIALIVIGSILLLLGIAYVLFFFVLNKWVRKEDKALRAFKLFGIKKDNKLLVMVFPFRFEYKEEAEIFDTREDALR